MNTVTITCTKQQINEIKARYPQAQIRKTPPYAHWQIKLSDCVITAFESGKVVFQGESASLHASVNPSDAFEVKNAGNTTLFPQCGSDEVGTGDYFGPVCVCAAYVDADTAQWLKEIGVQDSKALQDSLICKLAPQMMERLPHSLLILDNTTYNRIHPTNHMVAIKCKLHNQAFVHLRKKCTSLPDNIIIDQFVQEKSYYRYLQNESDVITGIHFETKAENAYLSVASASIIARYAFIKKLESLSRQYQFDFPKGAGAKVDESIVRFVAMHGKDALYHVAKLHFKNTVKAGIL